MFENEKKEDLWVWFLGIEIANIIKSTLNENKSMGKRQMEEILHMIDNARHKVVADAKYVKSSFQKKIWKKWLQKQKRNLMLMLKTEFMKLV